MSAEGPQGGEQVRSAELVAALCLATDLGMGFPFEHELHSTLIATRLADACGVDAATASQIYYACMLSHSGCTTDAHVTAERRRPGQMVQARERGSARAARSRGRADRGSRRRGRAGAVMWG